MYTKTGFNLEIRFNCYSNAVKLYSKVWIMISHILSQKSSQFSKNSEYQDSDLSSDDENSVDSVRNKLKLLRENQFKKPIDVSTSIKNNNVSSKFTEPIDQNKKIMTDLFGEDDDDNKDDDELFLKSIQDNTIIEPTSFISKPANKNTESTLIVTPPTTQKNQVSNFYF